MAADWSQLSFDLLSQIATNHLNTCEDFIMFSCVCRSWYHVFTMVKEIWDPSSHQAPWLVLAEPSIDMTSTNDNCRKLFNPSREKCYNFMLSETFGRRCWGSDHGWIVTLGLDREMHLVNPLTMVRQNLPSQRTFLHQMERAESSGDYERIRNYYIHKVRVFKMPACDNSCNKIPNKYQIVVMAIHGEWSWLSYAKPGDPSWMPIETTTSGNVEDVAYSNGLILIWCYRHQMVLNIVRDGLLGGSSRPVNKVDLPLSPQSPLIDSYHYEQYMFESFGDILMVLRYKINQDLGELNNDKDYWWNNEVRGDEIYWLYKTDKFEVFKFDLGLQQWKEVKDLGDRALFVGENGGISVQASTIINCKKNSIYFTDDEWTMWDVRQGSAGHDMGVYSMDDGSIQPIYQGDDTHSKFSCPFWFMPKFTSYSIYSIGL